MDSQTQFEKITAANQDCLKDESQYTGSADTVSYPENTIQLVAQLKECIQQGVPVTPQGSRTGLNGSGVPVIGHVMNLSRMNRVVEWESCTQKLENGKEAYGVIQVEAGITLEQLDKEIRKRFPGENLCFPIAPTELTATVGGVLSSGAGGIRGYYYGSPAFYCKEIEYCSAEGVQAIAKPGTQEFAALLGGEGMFGVIAKAKLYLVKRPAHIWGIVFFSPGEEEAMEFSAKADSCFAEKGDEAAQLLTLEYIDRNTVEVISEYQPHIDSIAGMPPVPETAVALVYIELGCDEEDPIMDAAEELMEVSMESGCDPDESWAMSADHEVKRLQDYRHGATECINMRVAKLKQQQPGLTLLCSDICWPGKDKKQMLKEYKSSLQAEGLAYCIYGHIGQNHLYVTILPENKEEYAIGLELIECWMRDAAASGGQIWKDHGAGKLKRDCYKKAIPQNQLEKIEKDKQQMDPGGLFNPGNGVLA